MSKLSIFVLFLTIGLHFVEARRLPAFSQLKAAYPADDKYGGRYPASELMIAIGAPNTTAPNDTCPIRISTMLNLIAGHTILDLPKDIERNEYHLNSFKSEKSSFNMYFMFNREGLVQHLLRMYGLPLESWTPASFVGMKGIMVLNITGTTHAPCSALLWDSYNFYQAYGYLKHTNMSRVYFWQTPDEPCQINVKKEDGGGGGGLCFPSKATATLETGQTVAMEDLKIGQRVKTMSKSGKIAYTQVVTFLDKSVSHRGQYLTILTESGGQISMKASHLIFKAKQDMTSHRLFSPAAIHASKIRPGDLIYIQSSEMTITDRVVGVAVGSDQGAYAPVTSEGTLLVDGVLVSCFADYDDHEMAQYLMGPVRMIYNLAPNSVGAHGHHIHWFLRSLFRPVAVQVLGKHRFYQGLSDTESD